MRPAAAGSPLTGIRAACFDWGGTLMAESGPMMVKMTDWPEVVAVPGAAEALARLHGRVPIAVATNAADSGPDDIRRALARVGLDGYIGHIFCARTLGVRKDDPDFWAAVSRTLGVPVGAIAMVGDSYRQDALGPRRAGVHGVWFAPDGAPPPAGDGVPSVRALATFAEWVLAAAVAP